MATEEQAPENNEAAQAGVLVWGTITASLSELFAPLLIVRLLGKGEVGAVFGLLLIYTTLAMVLSAGFPRATLYFLADRTRGERRAIVEQLLKIMAVLAVALAVLMALGGLFGADVLQAFGDLLAGDESREDDELVESLRYLPLLGLFALVEVPTRLLPNVLVAEGEPQRAAGFGVVMSLVRTVATILPASLGMGVFEITLATAVSGLIPLALMLAHLRRLYAGAVKPERSPTTVRELIKYSLPLGATDAISILNKNVDMWLIVALFTSEAVAMYRMGAFQIPIITTVAYSLGDVYLSRFARLHKEGGFREAVEIWRNSALKVSLIVVPASAVFLIGADQFITIAFTADYLDAAPVFQFYCLLMMARISAFGSFMLAAGKPEYVMRSAALTLLGNIAISVPLALSVGFLGPAMGTAIAFVPTLFFYCWFIAKAWNVKVWETLPLVGFLKIVAVVAVPSAIAWWVQDAVSWAPAFEFALIAVIVPLGFAGIGTVTKLIAPEDWTFVWSWVRLKVLKDARRQPDP